MPRLVAIINRLQSGGAERQLLMLGGGLASRGWDVEIWSLRAPNLDERTESLIVEAEQKGVRFDHSMIGRFTFVKRIEALVCHPPSILWPWGLRSEFLSLFASQFNADITIVGSLRWAMEKRIAIECRLRKFLGQRIVGYISNTEYSCDLVRKYDPKGSERRFFVVPNIGSSDTSIEQVTLPDISPKRLEIILVGHFRTWHKGYDLLPGVLRQLRKRGVNVRLRLAGSNDGSGAFLEELSTREFQNQFQYLGSVSNVREHLCSSHLYLMISRAEGMSNSLMEAMQVGLPCISTKVGDVGKVFKDGEHLMAAESEDVSGIAERIQTASKDWVETKAMAIRGRGFCLEYVDRERNEAKADQALRHLMAEADKGFRAGIDPK